LEAYKQVKANKGIAGVDGQGIAEFESNLKNNLYKLWNRMSSGSYFPKPVKLAEIPKGYGGKRILGIPTITDRIAQTVAKKYLEPELEKIFHEDSYGYRPNKSAIDAVGIARKRCWKYDWVIDLDIKGFFDNIDHDLMMKAVKHHTEEKWIVLYIERWLKMPASRTDGTIEERIKGTPQGGVISPILANLFLHYAYDAWMVREYSKIPFERYADDAIVHCRSKKQSEYILEMIKKRLRECKLELNTEKTKIVYCKDDNRQDDDYDNDNFDFLGYTYRPRLIRRESGKHFIGFTPGVSNTAKRSFRIKLRELRLKYRTRAGINDIANLVNPIIRGWSNYFCAYNKTEAKKNLDYVNKLLIIWAVKKHKRFKRSNYRAYKWVRRIADNESSLFAHWKLGVIPYARKIRAV